MKTTINRNNEDTSTITVMHNRQKKIQSVRVLLLLITLISILMGTTLTASASLQADVKNCSDTELIALLDEVQQEIADRHIERTAKIEIGTYIGGRDIPVGDYLLTKDTNGYSGIVWLQAKDDPKDNYPSKLYEFLSDDETGTFFITVEEGDTLCTPFPITLTISSGIKFK